MHKICSPARRWYSWLAFLAGALFVAVSAHADPAGRVGRIAWLSDSGAVNLYNPNTGESFSAPLNQPLTSGDVLTTETDSRAEIQIGSKTIRLDSNSVLELDRIDDEQVRVYLNDGRAIVKLPSREAARDFAIETRSGRFDARDTGIYRLDADRNGSSATVYYGGLHFEGDDSVLDIRAGESAQFWNDGQTRYRLSSAINDDFTQWSAGRDRRPVSNTYSRYVSPEMTGAEDLDAYGNWSENPEYGAVWVPRSVTADWAPYRTGHWAWIAPWGWSWVGNEPWGFAPFHYGRWVRYHGAWGWVPGTRIARPVYAPAMVAWVGAPGVGVSIAIGAQPTVGWFPLAPHEVYVPAYRSSVNYVRNVNITHVTNITNITNIVSHPQDVVQHTYYAHRDLPQAVTVVPVDVVTHHRPVESSGQSPRDLHGPRNQPVAAAALVSMPPPAPQVDAHVRQEPTNRPPVRQERERQESPTATPVAPGNREIAPSAPVPAVSGVVPQRGERPVPNVARPAPQTRPELIDRRAHDTATPAPVQVEKRELVQSPPASVPQAPAATPQRNERRSPEAMPRREAPEPRQQESAIRRDEPVARLPQHQTRIEQVVPQPRQAAPARAEIQAPVAREPRREAPREVSRPAEPRPEVKPQRQEGRPPPDNSEEEKRRRRQEGSGNH